MLSGTLYRLGRDTISVEAISGRKQVVRIPEGAVVEVLKASPGLGGRLMAEVRWEGKTLEMFAVDIERRGEAIGAQTTSAKLKDETDKTHLSQP